MPPPRRSWFRGLASAVWRTVSGRQPSRPAPEPEYPPPDYPRPPRDYPGGGGGYDEPPDYGPPPEEPWDWEPEIDLYDANNVFIGSNTKEEWMQELLEPKEVLLVTYGYSNLDIIDALIELGEWDDYDWEWWREHYGET